MKSRLDNFFDDCGDEPLTAWYVLSRGAVVILLGLLLFWCVGCGGALQGGTFGSPSAPPAQSPPVPMAAFDLVVCQETPCLHPIAGAIVHVTEEADFVQTTNGDGYTVWSVPLRTATVTITANGYSTFTWTNKLVSDFEGQHNVIALTSLTPQVRRPLVGALRLTNNIFVDDTGPRRVFFASYFDALRVLRDDPATFNRELDAITRAGYQGVRVFWAVGGYHGYWGGHEVAPVSYTQDDGTAVAAWPNYDDLFVQLLDACRIRGLRLALTTGDIQFLFPDPNVEIAQHQRIARLIAQHGGSAVVASYNVRNEYYVNSPNVGDDANLAQMRSVAAAVKAILPDVLVSTSNVGTSQDPPEYAAMAIGADDVQIHGTRSPGITAIDHAMHAVAWGEGANLYRPYAMFQMEPPAAVCDHGGCTDPILGHAELTGVYAMHAITGQASTFFEGNAVVPTSTPLEAVWGFNELPKLFDELIPEDVSTWSHGYAHPGSILWWWNATTTVTVCAESWDCAPAVPMQSATVIIGDQRFDNVTDLGSVLTPGFKAALIVGRR